MLTVMFTDPYGLAFKSRTASAEFVFFSLRAVDINTFYEANSHTAVQQVLVDAAAMSHYSNLNCFEAYYVILLTLNNQYCTEELQPSAEEENFARARNLAFKKVRIILLPAKCFKCNKRGSFLRDRSLSKNSFLSPA